MIARFFIARPIFAAVIAILITLGGGLSGFTLPISQYPAVTPPTIQVDCNYPGASAKVVSETVAAPIEQRVNGVERMLYMTSQSTSDGSYTLTIAFEVGTNLDVAQVMVQNRVNLALPELPDVVRATGVTTRKRSPEILLTVSMNSPPEPGFPDGRYDQLYLSNYAVLHVKDELSRIPGISDVTVFGQRDYSMRIWLDPEQLAAREVTALDVVNALRGQNAQVSLGRLGDPAAGTQLPLTMTGRLTDEVEFGNIVVKAEAGKVVRVREVATVELGAKSHDVSNRFDNKATVGLAIFTLSDANALDTADQIKRKMDELSKDFPQGVKYEIGYDTTPFMKESIKEVFKSLRDSILLVAMVVLIFLQTWRAAIIPLAAVPVAIIGTFGAMWAVGFGLNNLTLFGLVLSVGIVVDDAIVVVEAVQHQLELGYDSKEATRRAMDEVSGPIIAVGIVLAAVFVPCAFFPGIVGQFFRQFALTIAISTLISTFNSLSLSPALAAILLQPKSARPDLLTRVMNVLFGWLFWLFDRVFAFAGKSYVWTVGKLIRVPAIVLMLYIGALVFTYFGYLQLPTGFIPQQDKGYLIASIQLPDASSAERSKVEIGTITDIALKTPGIRHVNSVAGNSFVLSAYGSNFGSMFIILDDFDQRMTADLYSDAIAAKLRASIAAKVPGAQVNIFGAPAVPGLGRAGGFRLMVEDRSGSTERAVDPANPLAPKGPANKPPPTSDLLQGQTENLIEKANQQPGLAGLFTVYRTNSPQLYVKVDEGACSSQGVDPRDVYATMQATLGSRYVNDFNRFGRTWQVNVQAKPSFRNGIDDVARLKVRNTAGKLVPLGAVAEVKEITGPLVRTRYNMYPAAAVNGNVGAGVSTGDARGVVEQLAAQELPPSMAIEWTELAFIEQRSGRAGVTIFGLKLDVDTGLFVFGISIAVVFLVLAALYESWALPLAVILGVPVCVSCVLLGVFLTTLDLDATTAIVSSANRLGIDNPDLKATVARGVAKIAVPKQDVNIFTQVGFVVLIGLACKNAILIVEYAKRQRESGADRRQAVLAACRLRLRPILMTSVAFILGVTPLVLASGAGAEMRIALGLAVFCGMLGVTAFGIFLTPVCYVLIDWVTTNLGMRFPGLKRLFDLVLMVIAFRYVRRLLVR